MALFPKYILRYISLRHCYAVDPTNPSIRPKRQQIMKDILEVPYHNLKSEYAMVDNMWIVKTRIQYDKEFKSPEEGIATFEKNLRKFLKESGTTEVAIDYHFSTEITKIKKK